MLLLSGETHWPEENLTLDTCLAENETGQPTTSGNYWYFFWLCLRACFTTTQRWYTLQACSGTSEFLSSPSLQASCKSYWPITRTGSCASLVCWILLAFLCIFACTQLLVLYFSSQLKSSEELTHGASFPHV